VEGVRTPLGRYSSRHSHSSGLHGRFRDRFDSRTTLPYHTFTRSERIRSVGGRLKVPINRRRTATRPAYLGRFAVRAGLFLRSGVSCQPGINRLGEVLPLPLVLASRSTRQGIYHPTLPTSLNGARLAARPTLLGSASVVTKRPGPGLSTWYPSASARALSLGPTNPPRITRAAEP
jgi:hypothetical protein